MKRHNRAWTPKEDQELTRHFRAGSGIDALVTVMRNRNEKGIYRRLRFLGLTLNPSGKPWTTKENEKVVAGVAVGLSNQQIGAAIGRTHDAVRKQKQNLRKAGLIPPFSPKPAPAPAITGPARDPGITDADLEWMKTYRSQRQQRQQWMQNDARLRL